MSVTASSLHKMSMRVNGVWWHRTTLFPFFDGEGFVRSYMLVAAKERQVYFFDAHQGHLLRGFLGYRYDGAPLKPADGTEAMTHWGGYWHWDPWWMLKEDPFANMTFTPLLKTTNCVHDFKVKASELVYSSDLTRVTHVVNTLSRPYTATMLPPRYTPSTSRTDQNSGPLSWQHRHSGSWQLRSDWLEGWLDAS